MLCVQTNYNIYYILYMYDTHTRRAQAAPGAPPRARALRAPGGPGQLKYPSLSLSLSFFAPSGAVMAQLVDHALAPGRPRFRSRPRPQLSGLHRSLHPKSAEGSPP